MSVTLGGLIVWAIVGALAGSLVAAAVTRTKKGFGLWANILLGMAGAIVGGLLFSLLNIQLPGLEAMQFSFADLVVAVIGSVIVLAVYRFIRSRQQGGGAA